MVLLDKPVKLNHSSLRVIPFEFFTGVQNMSLDYYYSILVDKTQIPILRFYGWKPYCLSLGQHQLSDDIDINAINKKGIEVVRRPTGGSAIFHAEELTYSFILPNNEISHHEMYYMFHFFLCEALNEIGLNVVLSNLEKPGSYLNQGNETFACFNRTAKSEIQFKGKKVVGSAQKIYKNSILQHGSILVGKDHKEIITFLNLKENEQVTQTNNLNNNSISISEIGSSTINKIEISDKIVQKLADFNHLNNIFYKYTEAYELFEAEKSKIQFSI